MIPCVNITVSKQIGVLHRADTDGRSSPQHRVTARARSTRPRDGAHDDGIATLGTKQVSRCA
jgi:hypothetical protein